MDIAQSLLKATAKVTKAHTKQIKREERNRNARYSRQYVYSTRTPKREILRDGIFDEAYEKASNGGRHPANQRQVFYQARPLFLKQCPDQELNWGNFTKELAQYIYDHDLSHWRIIKDARGKLIEPHTNRTVPLGTLEVDQYLERSFGNMKETLEDEVKLKLDYPTAGPRNRYSAIVYVEKEGFNVILEDAGIPDRYDVAIASSKGQSVVAMRKLADEFCHADGVPLLIVHDFDKAGFEIAEKLTSHSIRYHFENKVRYIDLGLRLTDVEEYDLESEPCGWKGRRGWKYGTTEKERAFLMGGQRVELNAFTSAQFVEWFEGELQQHKIKKVVPDTDVLTEAYRRGWLRLELQGVIDDAIEELTAEAKGINVPKTLKSMINKQLKDKPGSPWDVALAGILKKRHDF